MHATTGAGHPAVMVPASSKDYLYAPGVQLQLHGHDHAIYRASTMRLSAFSQLAACTVAGLCCI